jgi:predicted RNase H-like HicB family nuclease
MRAEYDFSGGVRGKYAKRFRAGAVAVVLEPDVAAEFLGQTRADAITNVQEAIAGYPESLSERNEAIPPAIEEEVVDVAV